MGDTHTQEPPSIERLNSSSASSEDHQQPPTSIHAPVPIRPPLPTRKSSGTIIVPRDSLAVGPVETKLDPDDVRAMSPRRTSEDIEALGKEARDELKKHAKALQDSLLTIFHRIEAVQEEHDKLDSNNKFLQKYIGAELRDPYNSPFEFRPSSGRGSKKSCHPQGMTDHHVIVQRGKSIS